MRAKEAITLNIFTRSSSYRIPKRDIRADAVTSRRAHAAFNISEILPRMPYGEDQDIIA